MKKTVPILIFLILILSSCNKVNPSEFWNDFNREMIKKNIEDTGPWGGYNVIFWKTETDKFDLNNILKFANRNNWILLDSSFYSASDTKKWMKNEKNIFPIHITEFEGNNSDSLSFYNLPRFISGEFSVYKFKTNWLTYYPGTDLSTTKNGFLILSKNKKEMTVYHLWGE